MINSLIKNFRNKIQQERVFGIFSKTIDPAFVECSGYAGFDFIILDMEHGPNTINNMQNLIRAAQVTGLLPIVRVKPGCLSIIGEVLDIGAGGIQVPQVSSASDVKKIIKLAKFAPVGMRGVCRFVRAANYSSMDCGKYFKEANNALIVIQLEGSKAIENLDEILDINGYDVLFIGPYDLSQSLGVTGQINHLLVEKKMKEIVKKCNQKGTIVGNFTDTIEDALKWIKLGIRYVSYSVDVGLFYDSCKTILQDLKKI